MSVDTSDYIARSVEEKLKVLEKIINSDHLTLYAIANVLSFNGKYNIIHGTVVEHLFRNFGVFKEQGEAIFETMLKKGYFTKVAEDEYSLGKSSKKKL